MHVNIRKGNYHEFGLILVSKYMNLLMLSSSTSMRIGVVASLLTSLMPTG